MTKIKGTAQIKIYNPDIPNSERYIEVSNYVTEYLYNQLYNAFNVTNGPRRLGHLNIYIAYRTGYTINKTGVNIRFSYDSALSGVNQSGGLLDYGLKPSSQTSPIAYTDGVETPFVQFFNRINPPSITRSFNLIGLCTETSQSTVYPLTILLVEPVCTQSANEFIDVVYNLEIVKGSSYFFGSQFQKDWVQWYVTGNGLDLKKLRASYCNLPKNLTEVNGYEFLNVKELSSIYKYQNNLLNHPRFKHGISVELSPATSNVILESCLGFVINTLFLGEGYNKSNVSGEEVYPYYWEANPSIGSSPFQSKFNKKADALYPFWEATDTPNASGDVLITGTWNPSARFPEVLKILIVNGGTVGTATYRLQVKKFVRLCANNDTSAVNINSGNTWDMDRGDVVPFLNPVRQHPRQHGVSISCPKSSWKNEEILLYDMTGVTLLNIYDGSFKTWDNSSTPILNVNAVCQCEPVPSQDLIYVACRNTGLYRINTVSNIVTLLNSDPCYGVCVGGSGKVYAVFEGRISNSDNWTTPLSLVSAGITTGNTPDSMTPAWNRVRYIKASPWDTSDKLAIIITKDSGANYFYANGNSMNGYVVWWSPTLGSTPCVVFNNVAGTDVTNNPNAVACHPTINSWIVPYGCLVQWGSSTPIVSNLSIPLSSYYGDIRYNAGNITTDTINKLGWAKWYGTSSSSSNNFNVLMYYANFYKGYVVCRNSLVDASNGTLYKSMNYFPLELGYDQGGSAILIDGDLYLQWGGLLKGYYQLVNLFRTHTTNNARTEGWKDYGWNGTQWVEGNTTPRTTHSSALTSINGLNIQFVNGTTQVVPSFVAGQYILQYMCHGLLIDNTVSWYYEVNKYFTEYVTQSFPVGFNVPSSPNNGSYYEVTLPKYKKVPQSNTYGWVDDGTTDGINADPNFYSADMQSKRSFNIALNGVNIPYTSIFYWSEKQNPGPMEVSIEYTLNRTDRRMRFNAADAGKTITGTYVYMKCPT